MNLNELKLKYAVESPMGSAMLARDSQIIERPGWYQIITPSDKICKLNEVMLSHVQPHEISEIVSHTLAFYRKNNVPFKWAIGPMSSPARLSEILRPKASETWSFRGMACDTDLSVPADDVSGSLSIENVTKSNFNDYVEAVVQCWGTDAGSRESLEKRKHFFSSEEAIFHFYVAKYEGKPAGVGGFVLKPGHGYLLGTAVNQKFRGKGIYRALVRKRLGDLRDRGISIAVTQARAATSAPILERLGFDTVYEAEIFKFDLERTEW